VRRVVKDNPLAAYPYDTWSNGAASIQMAIDDADPDDTILVTNGVYDAGGRVVTGSSLTNRGVVDKAVTVIALSTNPADTVIAGKWEDNGYTGYPGTPPNGPGAIRCVYLAEGAMLAGFTLTNGATLVSTANDGRAGGVFCTGAGAVVSNCVIVNASGNQEAACGYRGTYFDCRFLRSHGGQGRRHVSLATLHRCEVIGKRPVDYYDGGVSSSTLYSCLVTRCYQKNGGGVVSSTLYDSIIAENRGGTAEGGASSSTLYNCTIASNLSSRTGAGLHNSTAINCRIFANEGGWYGAGAHLSTLYNCLIFSNKVTGASYGGHGSATYSSLLYNCT
jgi:hypothetical protein